MVDWNRIIVGDAFKLPSNDISYYRDLALMWPVLLFSLAAIFNIASPASPVDRIYGLKCAVLAIVALLLAKERLILIGGGAGFVALRLLIALLVTQDWRTYLPSALAAVTLVILMLWLCRRRQPSYKSPSKTNVLSLLVNVASLGATLAVFSWLRP